jgi:glycosyltransferase involved in cell wall biosynthesis
MVDLKLTGSDRKNIKVRQRTANIEMLRLMWLSDRMLGGNSAYSKITFETCVRLAKLGHKVAHIPMARANRMGKQVYEGVLIYPSGQDVTGEDVAVGHYVDWKADMLITLKEPWLFNEIYHFAINYVPYAIIDHSPVSPFITSRLHAAFRILVPSRHAQRELRHAGFTDNVHYIPHGVDTQKYRPLEDKAACRKLFFLNPDEFVVGVVAMNRARKMIPQMLRGYKRFREMSPDVKGHLMLWTNVSPARQPEEAFSGVADVGVSLLPEVMQLGLGEAVRWPKWEDIEKIGGLPEWDETGGWDMVKLYNCFDVLLLCSGGEGFGMPLIEAQACGVPVVTTDYAAAPEQVGAGLTVPWSDWVVINTPGTRYVLADVDKMAEALTKIMNADPQKLRKRARDFSLRYDWSKIISDYWVPFLEECEGELKPLVTKEGVRAWD